MPSGNVNLGHLDAHASPNAGDALFAHQSSGIKYEENGHTNVEEALNSLFSGASGSKPFKPGGYTDPALNAVTQADVDAYGGAVFTLTTTGNNQTLPAPTDTGTTTTFLCVNNDTSTDPITIIGENTVSLSPGEQVEFVWDGSTWVGTKSSAIMQDDGTRVTTLFSRNLEVSSGKNFKVPNVFLVDSASNTNAVGTDDITGYHGNWLKTDFISYIDGDQMCTGDRVNWDELGEFYDVSGAKTYINQELHADILGNDRVFVRQLLQNGDITELFENYELGTLGVGSVTASGTTVLGMGGTTFTTSFSPGDLIRITNSISRKVLSVTDDTHLEITNPLEEPSASVYYIYPTASGQHRYLRQIDYNLYGGKPIITYNGSAKSYRSVVKGYGDDKFFVLECNSSYNRIGVALAGNATELLDVGGNVKADAFIANNLTVDQIVEVDGSTKELVSVVKLGSYNTAFGSNGGTTCQGNDGRLSDSRTPTTHDITGALHSGILSLAKGGTNSNTALANDKVMVSLAGSIVESAITTSQLTAFTTMGSTVKAVDATGTPGEESYNSGYMYKCVATDTWVKWSVIWTY